MIERKKASILIILIFFSSLISSYGLFSIIYRVQEPSATISYQPTVSISESFNEEMEKNLPKTEPCPLTGAYYSKIRRQQWEKRRPLGVMIENHTEARPQSGLSTADIVFEAVAEGGITRFLAIFYCQDASYVGPIRSARIYFIKLLQGFGHYPLYVHVGGANTPGPADALGELKKLGWSNYNSLNQFAIPFPYFWRDYERLPGRAVEHTMYSSTEKLWQYSREKRGLADVDKDGLRWNESFKEWQFKDENPPAQRGVIEKIEFGFWESSFNDYGVVWNYDRERNVYLRVNGGQLQLDKNNNKQISAKNVVVVFAKESPANDGYPGGHLVYDLVGKGETIVFQNGKVIQGTWLKENDSALIRFFDEKNREISFVRGNTWIEILPIGNRVTY